MLFGLSTGELLLIGGTAAVVIGPRELPKLAKSLGFLVGSAIKMTRQGRRAFDEMSRTSELRSLHADVRASLDELYTIRNDIQFGVRPAGIMGSALSHSAPPPSPPPHGAGPAPSVPSASVLQHAPAQYAPGPLSAAPFHGAGQMTMPSMPPAMPMTPPITAASGQAPPPAQPVNVSKLDVGKLHAVGAARAPTFASPTMTDAIPGGADFVADAFAVGFRPPQQQQ